jgi:hypothetical protein
MPPSTLDLRIRIFAAARVHMDPRVDRVHVEDIGYGQFQIDVRRVERPWRQFMPYPPAHFLGDPADLPDHDRVLSHAGEHSWARCQLNFSAVILEDHLVQACRSLRDELDGHHAIRPGYPFRA